MKKHTQSNHEYKSNICRLLDKVDNMEDLKRIQNLIEYIITSK
ncbi:hypothetical protein [Anaerosporobacter sp.]